MYRLMEIMGFKFYKLLLTSLVALQYKILERSKFDNQLRTGANKLRSSATLWLTGLQSERYMEFGTIWTQQIKELGQKLLLLFTWMHLSHPFRNKDIIFLWLEEGNSLCLILKKISLRLLIISICLWLKLKSKIKRIHQRHPIFTGRINVILKEQWRQVWITLEEKAMYRIFMVQII